ncbi:hypothetical protein [Lysobacter gummosus]|uniref:hypothetical protein n=1 Tax=Lysobacter gummosus TaxID=262324 RepID=UPI003632A07A
MPLNKWSDARVGISKDVSAHPRRAGAFDRSLSAAFAEPLARSRSTRPYIVILATRVRR